MYMHTHYKHPMAFVSRKTGLSAHVLRAWEKRYGAVSPMRTQGNHRMYSDEDVERLLLLKKVIATGRSIGQVAHLSKQELMKLAEPETISFENEHQPSEQTSHGLSVHHYLTTCTDAVVRLDQVQHRSRADRCH
jgi:DNA-binding transcriptional MerR regulator